MRSVRASGSGRIGQLALLAISALLIVASVVHPYLPGEHDRLAVPLSLMAQAYGVAGAPLAVVGGLWLMLPRRRKIWFVISLVLATMVAAFLVLFAKHGVGTSFGLLVFAAWGWCAVTLVLRSRRNRGTDEAAPRAMPWFLLVTPMVTLAAQLVLATPATRASRDRAIAGAAALIADLESYRVRHGRYPESLEAQHADYATGVVGIERYHYASRGDSFDLSFEQPRFLLDDLGAREWLVYNPRDESRVPTATRRGS